MYRALESFTTNTYDVRRKQILADDFTTQDEIQEFLRIGYIEVYDGTLEITENGQYDVKDYEQADVDVSGGEVNLQSKTVAPTTSQQVIQADTGYDALASVTINATTSSIDNNITAENIKKDISILGVTGTYEGDVDGTAKFGNYSSTYNYLRGIIGFIETADFKGINLGTNLTNLFQNCINLKTVTNMDTQNVVSLKYTFGNCNKLENIPNLNTSSATDFTTCFDHNNALRNLPVLNFSSLSSIGNLTNIVRDCPNLTNESLNNLLASCLTIPSSMGGTKSLKSLGLSQTQAETCQTLSNWEAVNSAGWITGY